MLKESEIITDFDNILIELSPLIIREIRDKTEDRVVIYSPELQFQVKNISGGNLIDLNVEVNYYDSSGIFIGSDSDLRLEPLITKEVETFSLFIEPPEKVEKAELKIKVRRHNMRDNFYSVVSHPVFLMLLVALIIYSNVKH
jgi:hypothetical protein